MGTLEKIEALRKRKEKIEKELASIEAREKEKLRKEETRLKVLLGGALVADAKANPETISRVQEILSRAVSSERDRALLTRHGWLPGDNHRKTAEDGGAIGKEKPHSAAPKKEGS